MPCKGLPGTRIPTTAGSGSEVTRVLAVTDENNARKEVVYSTFNLADVVMLDPALTDASRLHSPPRLDSMFSSTP